MKREDIYFEALRTRDKRFDGKFFVGVKTKKDETEGAHSMKKEVNLKQCTLSSTIGPLHLVASDRGLRGVYWKKQRFATVENLAANSKGAIRHLREAAAQLEEYLEGRRKKFNLAIDLDVGTEFQRKVWAELARIPYGKTISYAELARKISKEKAVRAVGTANGRNPLSIIVPCHRVIASDGSLGGYAGGLRIKTRLLELENSLEP